MTCQIRKVYHPRCYLSSHVLVGLLVYIEYTNIARVKKIYASKNNLLTYSLHTLLMYLWLILGLLSYNRTNVIMSRPVYIE